MGTHVENFPPIEYFETVAAASARFLQQAYSAELAQSVADVIRAVGESIYQTAQQDPFDRMRDARRQLNRLFERLVASHGHFRANRAQPDGHRHVPHSLPDAAQATLPSDLLLFVYGTLKRGYSRSWLLSEQKFLTPVSTQPRYRLYDCGSYPALVEDPEGISIQGELWWVTAECVQMLDEVEGVPEGLYRRDCVALAAPFDCCRAQAYFYLQPVAGLRDCGSCWPNA
ncbi:MAG: hypothetical protein KatS3mg110_3943 [Pirellulaceae bacterium]|nr:MAG: hypothetical protein KatS3mg110_3943 [Pirellulaceae bacterium]